MATLKDGTALSDVERRLRYAERPGFRMTELQISPTQEIPSHSHTQTQATFSVLEGEIRVVLGDPDEELRLRSGEDDIASTALWYQSEPHAPYPPLPGIEALAVD